MIAKLISEDQRTWDLAIPHALAAYRASIHSSTGFTPNFLVFGRENRAPIDIVLGDQRVNQHVYNSYDEYVQNLTEKMRTAYTLTRINQG